MRELHRRHASGPAHRAAAASTRHAEPSPDSRSPGHSDVYAIVTERITAALEAGTIPWKKPWAAESGLPRNLASRRAYRGMNILLLALGQPYASPWWLTYKQAQELGGHVRKGERASIVTFWKLPDRPAPETDEGSAEPAERNRPPPILRYYHVFNLEQCEEIEAPPRPDFQPKPHEKIAICEAIAAGMPAAPTIGRDPRSAYYLPTTDQVAIPDLSQFDTPENYYATLFHELVHSTGHASRLARNSLGNPPPFGSPDYSQEELVAEFGAAFLCARAGIFPATVDNQASYINGWLAVLKKDKRLLPLAAAQAQKAADYIRGADPQLEEFLERSEAPKPQIRPPSP